jgi:hypothetical protein
MQEDRRFCRTCRHHIDGHNIRYINLRTGACYGVYYNGKSDRMENCICLDYIPSENLEYLEYLCHKKEL